jgi:hypothetical protein
MRSSQYRNLLHARRDDKKPAAVYESPLRARASAFHRVRLFSAGAAEVKTPILLKPKASGASRLRGKTRRSTRRTGVSFEKALTLGSPGFEIRQPDAAGCFRLEKLTVNMMERILKGMRMQPGSAGEHERRPKGIVAILLLFLMISPPIGLTAWIIAAGRSRAHYLHSWWIRGGYAMIGVAALPLLLFGFFTSDPNPNPIGLGLLFAAGAALGCISIAIGVVYVWFSLKP